MLAAGSSPGLMLTDKNTGQTIAVTVGQSLTVALPANPSTGYRWTEEPHPAGPLVESAPVMTTPARLGAGGTQTYSYRAVAPGTTQLVFDYARPWEHVPPVNHVAFTVMVRNSK